MAKLYPKKQTVAIFIVCIIAVAGVVIYVRLTPSTTANQVNLNAIASNPVALNTGPITTFSDWQKEFFGGATSTKLSVKAKSTATEEPLTLTDRMSRDFFTNYMELRQVNLTGNQDIVNNAMNQTIGNAVEMAAHPKSYAMSNVIISADSSNDAVRSYGNAVALIFLQYAPKSDAPTIATEALDQGDMNLLSGIDPILVSYDTMIKALMTVAVPQPLAEDHLDLINAISSLHFISMNLRNISNDSMQAMVSLSTYATTQNSMMQALRNMNDYFDTVGVSFAPSESGTLFSIIPSQS